MTVLQTIACTAHGGFKTWQKHMDGAAAILLLRGREQFQTPLGLRLFRQLRALIVSVA